MSGLWEPVQHCGNHNRGIQPASSNEESLVKLKSGLSWTHPGQKSDCGTTVVHDVHDVQDVFNFFYIFNKIIAF